MQQSLSQRVSTLLGYLRSRKEIAFDIIRIYLGLGLFYRGLIFLIHPEIVQ